MSHLEEYPDDDLFYSELHADRSESIQFADPGGRSALRAASKTNPRNRWCPTCKRRNQLTALDVAAGYQCDYCADAAERGADY